MSKKGKFKPDIPGRFIALPCVLFEHSSFRQLSNGARDIFFLMLNRFNGKNNGEIHLTAREIRKWYGMGTGTAHSKLIELYEHGLIRPNNFGSFSTRTGTTWVITFKAHGFLPATNEWKRYDETSKKVPDIEPYRSLDRTISREESSNAPRLCSI